MKQHLYIWSFSQFFAYTFMLLKGPQHVVCVLVFNIIHSLISSLNPLLLRIYYVQNIYWESTMSFLCGSVGKESTSNSRDLGLIPGLGRSPGEGKGYPLQYSGLENSMDYVVHGVTKSWTRLSDFHLHFTMCRNVGIYTWRLHDPFQVKVSYFEIPLIIQCAVHIALWFIKFGGNIELEVFNLAWGRGMEIVWESLLGKG